MLLIVAGVVLAPLYVRNDERELRAVLTALFVFIAVALLYAMVSGVLPVWRVTQ